MDPDQVHEVLGLANETELVENMNCKYLANYLYGLLDGVWYDDISVELERLREGGHRYLAARIEAVYEQAKWYPAE
jgi:hypothetical protein